MEEDPALVREDFEVSIGSWRNLGGDIGATVEKVSTDDGFYNHCVRLTNTNAGGNFAAIVYDRSYRANRYPFISFRYRFQKNVKLNLLAKVKGRWFEIGLTDDAKDYVRVNMEGIGNVPKIIDDDKWHFVRINLYQMLRTSAYLKDAADITVDMLVLADWGQCNAFEWATAGQPTGWVQIQVNNNIQSVSIYDRACPEQVTGGHIELDNGEDFFFGSLEDSGTVATEITINRPDVDWIKVYIDASTGGVNPGLGEVVFEYY